MIKLVNMSKIQNIMIIGILIVLFFSLGYFIKGVGEPSTDLQELQDQITILQNQNNQSQDQITSLQNQNNQLQQQINEFQDTAVDDDSQNATIDADCCTQAQKQSEYKCVQDCGPPVVHSGEDDDISYSCLSPEQVENRKKYGCPICLSYNTMISTPKGDINVRELKTGMLVWTLDSNGKKVAQPILKVSASFVPENHEVVHIKLNDGREVWASSGHPTTDRRTVEKLQVGHSYDGSIISDVILEQYQGNKTYDILPAGETGYYWANQILLGSTLKNR